MGDSRLRGNDVGGCGNDVGGCGNDGRASTGCPFMGAIVFVGMTCGRVRERREGVDGVSVHGVNGVRGNDVGGCGNDGRAATGCPFTRATAFAGRE